MNNTHLLPRVLSLVRLPFAQRPAQKIHGTQNLYQREEKYALNMFGVLRHIVILPLFVLSHLTSPVDLSCIRLSFFCHGFVQRLNVY